MPELPEVRAHAARLDASHRGATLKAFTVLNVAALKTVTPSPGDAIGRQVAGFTSRGKYFVMGFGDVAFVVHLMSAGRWQEDPKLARAPRGGMARWRFEDAPALLLTEAGKERRAGVWVVTAAEVAAGDGPLAGLGPEADSVDAATLAARLAETKSARLHGWLRDQRNLAGLGRRLANEVCHTAGLSPFALTRTLDLAQIERLTDAIVEAVAASDRFEAGQDHMVRSAQRVARVHHRAGQACPVCGDTVRSVTYSSYEVDYCPTCQTGGKVLADNTTSKFLK